MMVYELDDIEKEALLGAAIDRARADLNDGKPLTEMRQANQPCRWMDADNNLSEGEHQFTGGLCSTCGATALEGERV